jgi:hypothetical protein
MQLTLHCRQVVVKCTRHDVAGHCRVGRKGSFYLVSSQVLVARYHLRYWRRSHWPRHPSPFSLSTPCPSHNQLPQVFNVFRSQTRQSVAFALLPFASPLSPLNPLIARFKASSQPDKHLRQRSHPFPSPLASRPRPCLDYPWSRTPARLPSVRRARAFAIHLLIIPST